MTPPRLSPSKELLEDPIWTTWARYFSRVSQAKVLKYAHEIVARNLQVCCPPACSPARKLTVPCMPMSVPFSTWRITAVSSSRFPQ